MASDADFSEEQMELFFECLEIDDQLRGGDNKAWEEFAENLNSESAGVVLSAEDWKEKWLRDQVRALDALKNYTDAIDNRIEPDTLTRTDIRILQILKKTIPQKKRGRPKKRQAASKPSMNEDESSVKRARLEDSIPRLSAQLDEFGELILELSTQMVDFEKRLKRYLQIVARLAAAATLALDGFETAGDSSDSFSE